MADDTGEIGREGAEAVNFANIKTVGEGPAFYSNLAYKAALEAQLGWTTLNQTLVGAIAQKIVNTSPSEGGADIAALGQLMKGLQMTPPPTPSNT